MDWIYTKDNPPPLEKDILVKLKITGAYEVVSFYDDTEYGVVGVLYESYVTIDRVEKWCLIKE